MPNRDVNTITSFRVERVLKGTVDHRRPLEVTDMGGVAGEFAMGVSGGVTYKPGERVLMFLQRNGGGWTTYGMSLGKFNFAASPEGEELLVRWFDEGQVLAFDTAMNPHHEGPRNARAFLAKIANVHRQNLSAPPCDSTADGGCEPERPRRGQHDLGAAEIYGGAAATTSDSTSTMTASSDASAYPASAFTQGTFRWNRFDNGQSVTFFVSGRQPGYDDLGAAQRALGAWTNDPTSNVSYLYGGTTTIGFVNDGRNTIVYNASSGVPSGAIGYARWYAAGSHTYNGETFYTTTEGDVIMRSGLTVSQTVFDEAVTHEVGHTLGFRHSDQGTPASTTAVMNSVVYGKLGAKLAAWDVEAVSTVYAAATATLPPCAAPVIVTQPASTSVTAGNATTLTVTASGTDPLTYQWYIGTSGTISSPITGATTSSVTVTPSATTSYWVRVSNACGAVNSSTASVTVNAAPPPAAVRGDLNGDGKADLLWRNYSTGANVVWIMNGTTYTGTTSLASVTATQWRLSGAADFNADGHTDLVWHHAGTGQAVIWLMNRTTRSSVVSLPTTSDTNWTMAATGDLTGDGNPDIVWRNRITGANTLWIMTGATLAQSTALTAVTDVDWQIEAAADMNADGRDDLIWRYYRTGANYVWYMNGAVRVSAQSLETVKDLNWRIDAAADYDADGDADLVWRNYSTGANVIWIMSGATRQLSTSLMSVKPSPWELSGPR